MAHVRQEVLEREPSFADLDSTSSVVWKSFLAWVRTAGFHCRPDPILGGGFAMAVSRENIPPKTPATFDRPLSQMTRCHDRFFTATAQAVPVRIAIVPSGVTNGRKPVELLPGKVDESAVRWDRMCFSHSRSPLTGLVRPDRSATTVRSGRYSTKLHLRGDRLTFCRYQAERLSAN